MKFAVVIVSLVLSLKQLQWKEGLSIFAQFEINAWYISDWTNES